MDSPDGRPRAVNQRSEFADGVEALQHVISEADSEFLLETEDDAYVCKRIPPGDVRRPSLSAEFDVVVTQQIPYELLGPLDRVRVRQLQF